MNKKPSKFTSSPFDACRGQTKAPNALGTKLARRSRVVSAPYFKSGNPSAPRPTRARRRSVHRIMAADFRLSRGQQITVLNLPEVEQAIRFQHRVFVARAAQAMIAHGLGHNCTAALLQFPPSTLCTVLKNFRERGVDGLKPHQSRKPAGAATACKLEIFVGL